MILVDAALAEHLAVFGSRWRFQSGRRIERDNYPCNCLNVLMISFAFHVGIVRDDMYD